MGKGRTEKALRNVVFNAGNQVLSLILIFVSRTFFIRYLGVDYLGISGLFTDILNMLSLADLGFNTAIIYSLYSPLKNDDREKITALITFYRKIYIFIAIAVSLIGVALVPFLPYIINLDHDIPNLSVYYLLSVANVVISYVCVYKTSILNADQKQYKVTRVTIFVGTARTVLQILSLILFKSYLFYLILGCLGVFLTNIISSIKATKEYPYIKNRVLLKKEEKKDIFANIRSVFIYKISTILLTATDNTLISVIIGTVVVGYYSNYLLIQNKIILFYTLLFTSLTASIGNLVISETEEKRYSVFNAEQSVSLVIGGIVVPCYVLLVNDFINLWVGEEYLFSFIVVIAIGLNMYLSCALQPLFSFREATGLYRKTKWVMLICAILNIVFSIIFGKIFGIAGIIFATSLSKLLTYIWYEPKLLFNEYFGKSPKKFYCQLLINALLVSSIIVIGYYIGGLFEINSWLQWIIKAVFVFLISTAVVLIAYMRTDGMKIIFDKFLHIVKRR